MKNVFFLLIILFSLSSTSFAQENSERRELSVGTTSFRDLALIYRSGYDHGLWRLNLVSGNVFVRQSSWSASIVLSGGYEWRKPLTEKLWWRYGGDLKVGYSAVNHNTPDNDVKNFNYQFGANLMLGVIYDLSSNVNIGLEVLPGVNYNILQIRSEQAGNVVDNRTDAYASFDLSNTNVLMSIGFTF